MMRIAVIALGVIIALTVTITKLPASIIAGFIPANVQRWVSVHDIDGTLWNGGAKFSLPIAMPAAQSIEWRCAPSLFNAAVACELSGAVSGRVSVRPFARALELESFAMVQSISASPNSAVTVSAAPLSLTLTRGNVNANTIGLDGSALAKQALWRSAAQTLEFGEVSLDCKSNDTGSTECSVKNRAAPTTLDGKITLTPQRASGYIEYGVGGATKQRLNF
jgi:Type II secretion system (T2SS), protein N